MPPVSSWSGALSPSRRRRRPAPPAGARLRSSRRVPGTSASTGCRSRIEGLHRLLESVVCTRTSATATPTAGIPFNVVDSTTPRDRGLRLRPGVGRRSISMLDGVAIEGGVTGILLVDRSTCTLSELFADEQTGARSWQAGSGARWDLRSTGCVRGLDERRSGPSADPSGLARHDGVAVGVGGIDTPCGSRSDDAARLSVATPPREQRRAPSAVRWALHPVRASYDTPLRSPDPRHPQAGKIRIHRRRQRLGGSSGAPVDGTTTTCALTTCGQRPRVVDVVARRNPSRAACVEHPVDDGRRKASGDNAALALGRVTISASAGKSWRGSRSAAGFRRCGIAARRGDLPPDLRAPLIGPTERGARSSSTASGDPRVSTRR